MNLCRSISLPWCGAGDHALHCCAAPTRPPSNFHRLAVALGYPEALRDEREFAPVGDPRLSDVVVPTVNFRLPGDSRRCT